nr:MAG TPA: KilAC domain protein [Bacteriophage sp.]
MNEIILKRQNGQPVASSRDVAECFQKRHDHVLRDVDALRKDVPNFGEMFFESTEPDSYGRAQRAYLMNRDGFTLLSMGFTGKAALEWKLKYIEAFNAMEKQIAAAPQLSRTELMARALIAANEELKALDSKIQEMRPKEIFADAVSASKTSILIGELAKLLRQNGVEIGQNRLFDWMRKNGYLINRAGTDYNTPTQRAMEMGLFKVKETPVIHSDGHITVNKTTKVTGKGQIYFIIKFTNKFTVGGKKS